MTVTDAGRPAGPLSGILVLDLTRVLAGPFCTLVLADLGARVVKVEPPGHGDDARTYGPFVGGQSAYFASLNRGKESIALDLKKAADRAVFDRLLAQADILVENYRPGTMERLGYGWAELSARHPRLIYAAVSGFGHTGPKSGYPAYDMVVQGLGGIMSLTGHEGGPPTRVGTSVGDITAGLFTTIGITAALRDRDRTGRGMKVDVAMLDCQIAILENAIARYFATGETPGPMGARHPSITPFEAYATADGHMIVAAGNDGLFRRLAEALDAPALADDPRFATNASRTTHVLALKAAMEQVLRRRPTRDWLDRLQAAGIPSAPINTVADALADPQILARNMVVAIASEPPLRTAGNPIKLSAYPDPAVRAPAPRLDQDRAAVLGALPEPAASR